MHRSLHAAAVVLIAGCAANPDRPVPPRCDVFEDCFDRDRVRSFQVLDRDTLLVEVGPHRCPFLVEVDGLDCQLEFASRLAFGDRDFRIRDRRVCALDGTRVITDAFTRNFPMVDYCRVRNVRAISEDELLERHAAAGRVPPPPPTGQGELEVEEGAEASAPAVEPAAAPPEAEGTPAEES